MTGNSQARRNDPCPCGSGRRYKHCCGKLGVPPRGEESRVPPYLDMQNHVLVVPGFLTREECARLRAIADDLRTEEAQIARRVDGQLTSLPSERRITTLIKTFESPDTFVPVVARALRDHVEPAYATRIEWFEWPDVLLYSAGGRYRLHTDADLRDEPGGRWHRALDRDVSLLVYLNDDFAGGQLEFPTRGETIQPEAGMLVAFPSDHRFAHAALPVETGKRYVIVSWAATHGSPRVLTGPRLRVVYPDRDALPGHIPVEEIEGGGVVVVPRRNRPD